MSRGASEEQVARALTRLVDDAALSPETEEAEAPREACLWLKCVLGDQRTGEVLVDWDVERLPAGLRVSQLPSFLVQRFGPSLERWNGQTAGAAFPLPEGTGLAPEGTALAVIPLISDSEDQEAHPVAERLRDLERAFSDVSPGILERVALAQLWVGPLVDPDAVQQPLNDSAARACRAWLVGRGLATLIRDLAGSEEDALPHPGLEELVVALEDSAHQAAAAADAGVNLCYTLKLREFREAWPAPSHHEGEAEDSSVAQAQAQEKELVRHHLAARIAAREAERAARALAQLAFGVSASCSGGHVELVDRAAVAAILPPEGQGPAAALVEDGMQIRSNSRAGLLVELAGLICRLLVERRQQVRLWARDDRPALRLEIERSDTLVVSVEGDPVGQLRADLAAAGWSGAKFPGKPLRRRWTSPVSVVAPARLVARTFYDALGPFSPSRLRVEVIRPAE